MSPAVVAKMGGGGAHACRARTGARTDARGKVGGEEDGAEQPEDPKGGTLLIGGAPEERALHRAQQPRQLEQLEQPHEAQRLLGRREAVEGLADDVEGQRGGHVHQHPPTHILAQRAHIVALHLELVGARAAHAEDDVEDEEAAGDPVDDADRRCVEVRIRQEKGDGDYKIECGEGDDAVADAAERRVASQQVAVKSVPHAQPPAQHAEAVGEPARDAALVIVRAGVALGPRRWVAHAAKVARDLRAAAGGAGGAPRAKGARKRRVVLGARAVAKQLLPAHAAPSAVGRVNRDRGRRAVLTPAQAHFEPRTVG